MNKYIESEDTVKDNSTKSLNKYEYDLFLEENDIIMPVYRVKYFVNGDKWKIFKDKEIILIIESSKITKKQSIFLKSLEGVSWLLAEAKKDLKNFSNFKILLKNKLKGKK